MNKKRLFSKFISENIDNAYRFAFMYTKNQEDAEDIVSESIIKALKSVNSLKCDEYMKTWFYKIMINTAKLMYKESIRMNFLNLESAGFDENMRSDENADNSVPFNFDEMIENLPADYRIILILTFYEGYKIKEISEILDINESTVKKRLYTSLKILKKEMEEISND